MIEERRSLMRVTGDVVNERLLRYFGENRIHRLSVLHPILATYGIDLADMNLRELVVARLAHRDVNLGVWQRLSDVLDQSLLFPEAGIVGDRVHDRITTDTAIFSRFGTHGDFGFLSRGIANQSIKNGGIQT